MLEQIKNDFRYAKEIEGEDYGYKGLNNEQIEWLIEQVERVHEQADLLRKYRDVLREIADYPKVRGIGGLMDSYNEIITLAELAVKKKG